MTIQGDQVKTAIDGLSAAARSRLLYKADADCCHMEHIGDNRYLGVHIGAPTSSYRVLDTHNHWILLEYIPETLEG